jgi:hypothetical protein
MRSTVVAGMFVALVLAPRPSEACIQLSEANKLLGWSADGTLALHVRVDKAGTIEHAEIHPTRFEGWKYIITADAGAISVGRVAVGKCDVLDANELMSTSGKLTEETLKQLAVVKAMKLVAVSADDGGASKLAARFVPAKRYAEHQVEVREGATVTTLPVPVWCLGSCLRDEDRSNWGAQVRFVAKAGTRTLYVIRMTRVCNGGNDKDLWMDRVIAVPGPEARPKFGRCRGSGA